MTRAREDASQPEGGQQAAAPDWPPVSPISAGAAPQALGGAMIVQLQQRVGNATVSRMIAAGQRVLQRDPSPAPATPAAPAEAYRVVLTDGVHPNLSKTEAINVLAGAEQRLTRAVNFDVGEYAEVNKGRQGFLSAIGAAFTDLAGMPFPSYEETWAETDKALTSARHELRAQNVEGAADRLKQAREAYEKGRATWYAYKAQIDKAGSRAETGIEIGAVVAVAVIATGGAAAGVLAPEVAGAGAVGAAGAGAAGGGAAGAGAAGAGAAGGGAVVGGGVGGAAALGATVPVDVAAAGTATTVVAGAAGGTGAATGVAGATTVAGLTTGAATADAVAGAAVADTMSAMTSGGTAAATAVAQGMPVTMLEGAMAQLSAAIYANQANPAVTATELAVLKEIFDILQAVWKGKLGLGG